MAGYVTLALENLNHELEIISANMLFSKAVLLTDIKILYMIVNILKASNGHSYHPQAI